MQKKTSTANNLLKSVIWPIINNPNCINDRIKVIYLADGNESSQLHSKPQSDQRSDRSTDRR